MSKSWSGRVIDPGLLAEIDKLPDVALVDTTKPTDHGCWYAVVSVPKGYLQMSADFSTGGKTEEDVVEQCAKAVREDLRGVGKFATHFDDYLVRWTLLPHWQRNAWQRKVGVA